MFNKVSKKVEKILRNQTWGQESRVVRALKPKMKTSKAEITEKQLVFCGDLFSLDEFEGQRQEANLKECLTLRIS